MKKKFTSFLALILSLVMVLSLVACGGDKTGDDSQSGDSGDAAGGEQQEQNTPAKPESLKLEICTESSDALLDLQSQLPALLQAKLKEKEFDLSSIEITFSTSAANSITAVKDGSIDLAWVDGKSYVQNESGVAPIVGSFLDFQYEDCGLILAAPTDTGLALHQMYLKSKDTITWDDINARVWGVVDPAFNNSQAYLNVWLYNKFGKSVKDLANVKTFENSWEAMRAASKGEVDMCGLIYDDRTTYAALWQLPVDQQNDAGIYGFGRTEHVSDGMKVLTKSEYYYEQVIVAKEGSACSSEDFAKALTSALNSIVKDNQQLFPAHLYRKNKAIDSADMEPMRVWLKNNF